MPRFFLSLPLIWIGLVLPAAAEEIFVDPCGPDVPGLAWSIAEPWEDNTLTFADGAVRLAILDTVEPAAAAYHLLILSPPYDELGLRQCRVVSMGGAWIGFGFLSFERHEAQYDPATGLTVVMDMGRYNPATGLNDALSLSVTINQATGEISGSWP